MILIKIALFLVFLVIFVKKSPFFLKLTIFPVRHCVFCLRRKRWCTGLELRPMRNRDGNIHVRHTASPAAARAEGGGHSVEATVDGLMVTTIA